MIDILICAMPHMHDMERVPAAPAMLKSAAQNAGYTAYSIDLNLEFFIEQCDCDIGAYYEMGCVWRPYDPISSKSIMIAQQWVQHCLAKIQQINPKTIGISVFTNFQHRSSWMLLQALHQHMPDVPIVIGGFGCEISAGSLIGLSGVTQLDRVKPFWQLVKDKKLINHVSLGGGGSLSDFVDFLDRNLKKVQHEVDHDSHQGVIYDAPVPDYSDYRFDQYVWNGAQKLAITGSKGCVRACTFCDVPGQFGRFQYRRGSDIANEIILQNQRHGVRVFEFTDSLVNGSFKAFREWLEILAEYNDSRSESERISWFGQYICRPQKHTPGDIYKLMRRSGVTNLVIGVESGSNAVLEAMQKKITVQDVYDELEQLRVHGISCDILMFTGFYNETAERFNETLRFLQRCQKYVAHGTIQSMGLGAPLYINDLMYLGQHAQELGIIQDENHDAFWTTADDPDNTYVTRVRRRVITQMILDLLGFPLSTQHISNLKQSLALLGKTELELLEKLDETATAPQL